MIAINITILGEPKPQPRHRHFRRGNFSGTYDPAKEAKSSFLSCMLSEAPAVPLICALEIRLGFYFPRVKSHYGTGRNAGVLKKTAPMFHVKKPDTDNLIKFVLDSMNKIFFFDDSQIVKIVAIKYYNERTRTEIVLSEYMGGDD